MAIWSSLAGGILRNIKYKPTLQNFEIQKRLMSGHETFALTSTRFQFRKFKNLLHFYFMLGFIPCSLVVFYINVTVGPARLAEIPEGYTPKHWEYFQHPITRWLAQHVYTNPQQEYEKYLHELYERDEKMKLRMLEKRVKDLMAERNDYDAYYHMPMSAKYVRIQKQDADTLADVGGFERRVP
ncbi:hypothetical protein O3M35_009888 [Rhynocoris fuscipes]|uniref:NADH dehydrogenase [ubiquinone] 1 beta subcomplex subunit 5, mitochondrial n=1 Tax=Rhynocoris fuscipes TaxID=488301 RepID=A0AAW1D4P9_9HEMI